MTKAKNERSYIRMLLAIAIPMMVQNGISNFVNLLDNLMIGKVGTNALSGVAIANQLMFVFFLVIFGATAGAGIFTAQYKGNGDNEGIRYTFRFKIVFNTLLAAVCTCVLLMLAPTLINLFLLGEGDPADAAETLKIGISYMRIILISLVPVGLTQAYAGTLRDLGSTRVPMYASICAILVNLVGNWLLIYGKLGLPALGADGAAIATVISRFVELAILIIYTGRHSKMFPFIKGAFKNFKVPVDLVGKFILKSLPLMLNETLWSLGMTVINQSYSYRSLDAVAAMNIQSTIWNVMGVSFLAMGEAVGIMMGHILGSGELDTARQKADTMRWFTVACGVFFAAIMAAISPFFPLLYNTSDEIRSLASGFILIAACAMPFVAYTHASYFIIRSGGNTLITVLFDSIYTWAIAVSAAFFMSRYTDLSVTWMLAVVNGLEVIKCFIAFLFVRSGMWVKNLVKAN
ncbi:MAG: MATE family efflux transporter [Ruminococcaceae bacterium]|nr:MATE family efflux transporter [Oscillospiraceae bacterium]